MAMSHLPIRRREALIALGGLAVGAGVALRGGSPAYAAPDCLLQREVTEGPYYLDLDLVRRNIKGDRRGTPLALRFTVVDAATCRVLPAATVEIWHADAAGTYSGVSGNGGNFLRGAQRTSSRGVARFDTIFPGWYRGRTPHIHMKVFAGGDEVHTGQVFFRPAVTKKIYGAGVYRSRGQADTSNASDSIYREAGERGAVLAEPQGQRIHRGDDHRRERLGTSSLALRLRRHRFAAVMSTRSKSRRPAVRVRGPKVTLPRRRASSGKRRPGRVHRAARAGRRRRDRRRRAERRQRRARACRCPSARSRSRAA